VSPAGEANYDAGRISVLAPLGTALLGYRVANEIEWEVPRGMRRLRIDAVLFNPKRPRTRRGEPMRRELDVTERCE
jgi:hypothetical protein